MISLLKDKAKENKSLNKKLKKLEEKYVDIHKQHKGLIQDREAFIAFLHMVFPQNYLDELLLPDDQFGLYDIDHIKSFWTLMKSQNDTESTHIIEIMKEEKKVMYQKISQYEREISDKEDSQRKIQELEGQIAKLMDELEETSINIQRRDQKIFELEEKIKTSEGSNDRIKELERECAEMKASQLMNMFGSAGSKASNSKQFERQLESMKVQLSEKTNEILRIRDENEQLSAQIDELQQKQTESLSFTNAMAQDDFLNNRQTDEPLKQLPGRVSNLSQSNSLLEHSMELEDPKYRLIEQTLRERDEEVEKLQNYNQELDSKLQQLLGEFSQFRNKAQQMLTSKDEELDKFKGRSNLTIESLQQLSSGQKNKNSPDSNKYHQNYYEENGYESSASTYMRRLQGQDKDKLSKETLNTDYIKNVFFKYLEYQANYNEKEAMTMEKVLFTVLKASEKDIEKLEKARQKNTGGIFSYFYSNGASSTVPRPVQPRLSTQELSYEDAQSPIRKFNSHNGAIKVNEFGQGLGLQNEKVLQNATIDQNPKNDNRKYFNINISN
ncbi:abc transporter family protein [Stylonychia lemnae]|uniref:Abc transporter family protein n=1 Tax=Stylonychia lemnae TaxID=5949 RepID=A0A078ASC4_STYLE|nr:abc transporter family protein [Stylonychia lemnae]|eukprot:CDW85360.1 abc transporter family protein [Stylonychia lemnae]